VKIARLILASSSKSRAGLLTQAGIDFIQVPSSVDEEPVKTAMAANRATAAQCAIRLAEMKATSISTNYPEAYVIGCDQMLDCAGQWFDKPTSTAAARAQLQNLRGKSHALFNGMVVVRAGQAIWHYTNHAELEMRAFSDGFLDAYLANVGDDVLWSVGGYQLEGAGAQLFTSIKGDFFSILGLPLLPLLGFLREHGLINT
jgi:septum formation protein